MFVCVCMWACVHVCVRACVHVCAHACVSAHVAFMYVKTYLGSHNTQEYCMKVAHIAPVVMMPHQSSPPPDISRSSPSSLNKWRQTCLKGPDPHEEIWMMSWWIAPTQGTTLQVLAGVHFSTILLKEQWCN